MKNEMSFKLVHDFRINQSMVDSFARVTGDYNSMHTDIEVARKSRFRRTIVHGMLPFSFLTILQTEFPDRLVIFKELSGHFNKPAFVDDEISLELKVSLDSESSYKFSGSWRKKNSNELVLMAKGQFTLLENAGSASSKAYKGERSRDCLLLDAISENSYLIEEVGSEKESLDFELTEALIGDYVANILDEGLNQKVDVEFCPNLLGLLMFSTMVGMRLPGRYATFTRFKISFESNLELHRPYVLESFATSVSVAAEHIKADAKIMSSGASIANGSYEVIVNPPPRKMPSCNEIIHSSLDLGLHGKVALVTGSSRGIGETTAKFLAMHGVKTVVNYHRGKADADNIVKEIVSAGGNAIALPCDLTDENQVAAMMSAINEKFGDIDILVNNSVRDFAPREILELEWSDFLQEMEVAVKGMHECCKAVIPGFRKNGRGKIINLSTIAVATPVSGQCRYITSKSAVEGYTKSLAVELASSNVQVNLVVPNMAETDLISVMPTLFREKLAAERVAKRHIQPIEVAQAIVYLASDWSNAMTGQKIVLNLGEPPFA